MLRFLCLALLAEICFAAHILERIEKKPVVLTEDKLKTDTHGKVLIREKTIHPMIEETREKVLETPMDKAFRKPIVAAQIHRSGLVDDAVKLATKPTVEKFRFRHPFEFDDDVEDYFPEVDYIQKKQVERPFLEKYRFPSHELFDDGDYFPWYEDIKERPVVTGEVKPTAHHILRVPMKFRDFEDYDYDFEDLYEDIRGKKPLEERSHLPGSPFSTVEKTLHHKITPKHVVTAEKFRFPLLDDRLEELYDFDGKMIEPKFDFKIDSLIDTHDDLRKVCVFVAHRVVYSLAEVKKTGIMPEPTFENKRQVKRAIRKIVALPKRDTIRKTEEDIKDLEIEMGLPITSLTPKLRKMKREMVNDCRDKYPVL